MHATYIVKLKTNSKCRPNSFCDYHELKNSSKGAIAVISMPHGFIKQVLANLMDFGDKSKHNTLLYLNGNTIALEDNKQAVMMNGAQEKCGKCQIGYLSLILIRDLEKEENYINETCGYY